MTKSKHRSSVVKDKGLVILIIDPLPVIFQCEIKMIVKTPRVLEEARWYLPHLLHS